MMARLRILTTITLLLALLPGAAAAAGSEPKRGGTLTFAVATTPPTLDWHTTARARDGGLRGMYIGEPRRGGQKFVPIDAGERWASAATASLDVPLRRNVKFHNGKVMTSEDVVASLNRWRRVSPRAEMMAKVKDVVATDKHTVVFRLSAPLATLPFILSREGNQPVIHPKEIIENAAVNKLSAYVGTGPYRLGEWIPDRHIILERFPDYAARTEARGGMAGKKVAYLDRIVFRSIPESEVRLAGLRTGEFDGVQPLPQEYLKELKGLSGVQPLIVKFDMKPTVYFSMDGITKDVKLRKAIRAALNMEDIMLAATGDRTSFDLNPDQPGSARRRWERSRQATRHQNNPRSPRSAPGGRLQGRALRFLASATQFTTRPAVMIHEQLKAAGFNVILDLRDWPTVSQMQRDAKKWDLTYTRTVLTVPSEAELVTSMGSPPRDVEAARGISLETDVRSSVRLRTLSRRSWWNRCRGSRWATCCPRRAGRTCAGCSRSTRTRSGTSGSTRKRGMGAYVSRGSWRQSASSASTSSLVFSLIHLIRATPPKPWWAPTSAARRATSTKCASSSACTGRCPSSSPNT